MKTVPCVCVIILNLLTTSMGNIVIIGSSVYVNINQTFMLTCIVTGVFIKDDVITFFDSRGLHAKLAQKSTNCSVSTIVMPEHCDASCGRGTSGYVSSSRQYTLTIKRVAANDSTDWFCEQRVPLRRSNTFTLQLRLRGTWSTWNLQPGDCEASCTRNIKLTRSCNYPEAPQKRLLPCLGNESEAIAQSCQGDSCIRGQRFTSKIITMVSVSAVLGMVGLVLLGWCCSRRTDETEESVSDATVSSENSHQSVTDPLGNRKTIQHLLESRRHSVELNLDIHKKSIAHMLEEYKHVTTPEDVIRKYQTTSDDIQRNVQDDIGNDVQDITSNDNQGDVVNDVHDDIGADVNIYTRLSRSQSMSGAKYKKKKKKREEGEGTVSPEAPDEEKDFDPIYVRDGTGEERRVSFSLPTTVRVDDDDLVAVGDEEQKATDNISTHENPAYED